MRLTFVLDTFDCGGKERRCLQIIQGLNRAGYKDLQVIIINNEVAYKELYDTTAQIEIIDRKNKKLNQLQTAKALYALIKGFSPNIVQAWGVMSAGAVLMVKPLLKFVFLASYVADVMRPKGINAVINKCCCLFCRRIIGNSKAGIVAYGIPKSKAIVIHNGFNELRLLNKIDKEQKKNDLQITTSYVVIMVATFWKGKDWNCFLQTAKAIIKERKDITFLAVGSGPSWKEFDCTIIDEERGYIKMMGRRDDVDELFQICDISVLVSNYGEGVSNSIMESMAFGVPVVATDSGGTPEIIIDKENGLLLKHNNVEELKEKILMLVDNKDVRFRLAERAAETIKESFLLEKKTQQYVGLYESLLEDQNN